MTDLWSGDLNPRPGFGAGLRWACEAPRRLQHGTPIIRVRISCSQATKRLLPPVPVFVSGREADSKPFSDVTQMTTFNLLGGLVLLAAQIEPNQMLLLVNNTTQQARACRAAYVGPERGDRRREVGVEFLRPSPNFWKIHFPPDNPEFTALRTAAPGAAAPVGR